MEVSDPPPDSAHNSIRAKLSKGITSLSATLSSLHLPFRFRLPHLTFFSNVWNRLPEINAGAWIILARVFAFLLVISLVYAIFVSDLFTIGNRQTIGQMFDPESVRVFVQSHADENRIRGYFEHLTAYPHLAGTEGDFFLAQYVESAFATAGLVDVQTKE
jgi:hypothetical protein